AGNARQPAPAPSSVGGQDHGVAGAETLHGRYYGRLTVDLETVIYRQHVGPRLGPLHQAGPEQLWRRTPGGGILHPVTRQLKDRMALAFLGQFQGKGILALVRRLLGEDDRQDVRERRGAEPVRAE